MDIGKYELDLEDFAMAFDSLEDPRSDRNRLHPLLSVLAIAVMAILAGAGGPTAIARWANHKADWLTRLLPLPNGIPRKDVFRRVLMSLDPATFQACFVAWIEKFLAAHEAENDRKTLLNIDGKTLRRSHDKAKDLGALHSVSVWAGEYGLTLAQVSCAEKSNEITAIPEVLKLVSVKGAIVTIDAMGTQKEIAKQIVQGGGDYVLALKGNQGKFHRAVVAYVDQQLETDFQGIGARRHELRTIVAPNATGNPTHREQLRQRIDHVLARDAPVHFQRQALPRKLVHDRKPLQRAPRLRPVEHKIPAPHIVPRLGFPTIATVLARTQSTPFSPFLRHFQPLATPQPIHPRRARPPAFLTQQPTDLAITRPRTLLHQFTHPPTQRRFVVPGRRFVTLTAPRLIQNFAGPSLGNGKLGLQRFDRGPLPGRAHQFPALTCFSIRMSSCCSATISLRRLFSSSSCFSRFASSDFIPPYCFSHRWYVDSLTPSACSIAAASWPAFNIAAASRSFFTISSGVCRFRRIVIFGLLARFGPLRPS